MSKRTVIAGESIKAGQFVVVRDDQAFSASSEVMSLRQDIVKRFAEVMAAKADELIAEAIKKHLMVDTIDLAAIAGRLQTSEVQGTPGVTYSIDGVAILWMDQFKLVDTGDSQIAGAADYRFLI